MTRNNESFAVGLVLFLNLALSLFSSAVPAQSHAILDEGSFASLSTQGGQTTLFHHSVHGEFQYHFEHRPSFFSFSRQSGDLFVSYVSHDHEGVEGASWIKVFAPDGRERFSKVGDIESAYPNSTGSHYLLHEGPGPRTPVRVLGPDGKEIFEIDDIYVGAQMGFSSDGGSLFTLQEPERADRPWILSIYDVASGKRFRAMRFPAKSEIEYVSLFSAKEGVLLQDGHLVSLPTKEAGQGEVRRKTKRGDRYLGLGNHGRNGTIVAYREDGFDLVRHGETIARIRESGRDSLPAELAWLDRNRIQPFLNSDGNILLIRETWGERRQVVVPISDVDSSLKVDLMRILTRDDFVDSSFRFTARRNRDREAGLESVRRLN